MMNNTDKVFIDSNMILYAAGFKKESVFEWMNQLYSKIYIHIDVYNELLTSQAKESVDNHISNGIWELFNPEDLESLTVGEQDIYNQRLEDITLAFHNMNLARIEANRKSKNVSNLGEIATIAACTMIGARIICSNDFDIRTVVEQENYRVTIADEDVLIQQDSAEDFCVSCYENGVASRKLIRNFYKTIIFESRNKEIKLLQLDQRLDQVEIN